MIKETFDKRPNDVVIKNQEMEGKGQNHPKGTITHEEILTLMGGSV